ncbi:MAG: MOP flippase family protein [Desulfobacterales bacterium]|nr:MOP flippase family protein [Desulfobacterales bacterium]
MGSTDITFTNSLKTKASHGVQWTAIASVVSVFIQFTQITILGHMLLPKDFGLMAMVMIIVEFSQIYADMGLSTAIIQRKDPKIEELSTLYWFNICVGICIFILLIIFSPIVAKILHIKELKEIIWVFSLVFIISPFGSQFQSILSKSLKFDILAFIEIGSMFTGLIVAIILAYFKQGVWSLVFGQMSKIIVQSLFFTYYGWSKLSRPLFYFKISNLKDYLSFGIYRVGIVSASLLGARIDQLIIGIVLGSSALGYYDMASRLAFTIVQKINPILTTVAFPIFSIVQEDIPILKKGYLKMIQMLTFINAPILIGFSAIASNAIPIFLGEQWVPAISTIQILTFCSLVRSIDNAGTNLIYAKGYINWHFYWSCALLFIIPAVIYASGKNLTPEKVALSMTFLQIVLSLLLYYVFIRRIIGHCFIDYIRTIGLPIILALCMAITINLFNFFDLYLSISFYLGFQICFAIIIYILLSWIFNRQSLMEFIRFLTRF